MLLFAWPIAAATTFTAAITLFTIGTQIGTNAQLTCIDEQSQLLCCNRIFNISTHQIISNGCIEGQAHNCPAHTSATCQNIDGSLTPPNLQPSRSLLDGISIGAVLWALGHIFLAETWLKRHEYEFEYVLEDGLLNSGYFKSAQCSRQGRQVFARFFVTTGALMADFLGMLGVFALDAYPKQITCPGDGFTCCTEIGCDVSLSAFPVHCNIDVTQQCVGNHTFQSPQSSYTATALTVGITTSVMLGLSTLFAILSNVRNCPRIIR